MKVNVFYEVTKSNKKPTERKNEWIVISYKTRIKIGEISIKDKLDRTRALKLFETINYYCASNLGYEPFEFEE